MNFSKILIGLFFVFASSLFSMPLGTCQYAAKLYSEALGRAPDHDGWVNLISYLENPDASKVQLIGIGFLTSQEFYDNYNNDYEAMLRCLYRLALYREVEEGVLTDSQGYLYQLQNQLTTWNTVVTGVFSSAEFNNIVVPLILADATFGWRGSSPSTTADIWTADELQSEIDAVWNTADPTVRIPPKTLILVDKVVVVHEGVTVRTDPLPYYNSYASMARLFRTQHIGYFNPWDGYYSDENNTMIRLEQGARIEALWLDGNRSALGFGSGEVNVVAFGNSDFNAQATEVVGCRLSNSSGWTQIHVHDANALSSPLPGKCNLFNNLITTYSSKHCYTEGWADGISFAASSGTIQYNSIIDATDVGIVIFGSAHYSNVNVYIYNNNILNAGNSIFAGIHFTPPTNTDYAPNPTNLYQSQAGGNQLFTSPEAHMNIGICIGAWPWPDNTKGNGSIGTGVSIIGNRIGFWELHANVGIGVAISGVYNAEVPDQDLHLDIYPFTAITGAMLVDLDSLPVLNPSSQIQTVTDLSGVVVDSSYDPCDYY